MPYIHFEENDELLDIRFDNIFKAVFARDTPASKGALSSLVSALIGTDSTYNDLKEAYQIAILAKERFFKDEAFLHNFEYYDPDKKISFNGRSRIITLELSKLEQVVEKPAGEMSVQESWAVYFQYLNLSPR